MRRVSGSGCRARGCAVVSIFNDESLFRMCNGTRQRECGFHAGSWVGWEQIRHECQHLLCALMLL